MDEKEFGYHKVTRLLIQISFDQGVTDLKIVGRVLLSRALDAMV